MFFDFFLTFSWFFCSILLSTRFATEVHARKKHRILPIPFKRLHSSAALAVLLRACYHHELSIFKWPRKWESGPRLHRSEGARCNVRRAAPPNNSLCAADQLCDMAFDGELMADPVFASDGITYERHAIELWMRTHDVSPITNKPFHHKLLIPNLSMCSMVAEWCEQNGVPVPTPPKREAESAGGGGGAALAPLPTKPQVTCSSHPKEQLRAFCTDCCCAVCVLCAVDVKRCKAHSTEALDTVIEELKTEREAWSRAQEECRHGAEQLCLQIQAHADTKIQRISSDTATLQQQVFASAPNLKAHLVYCIKYFTHAGASRS
jgi:hypothetical protein